MTDSTHRLNRFLHAWIERSIRFRHAVVVLFVVAATLALVYTLNHISINTNTRDMLSQELDWRELDLAYESEFPMYVDTILVVVEAPTPDQAADAAQHLSDRLRDDTAQYESVYYAAGLDFFRRSALLYLDPGELQDLADQLAAIQPFLGRLVQDQSLRGLFGLIRDAVEARREGQAIEIDPFLERIAGTIAATRRGEDRYLSWQALITGEKEAQAVYREFIVIKPKIDYASLLPGETAVRAVRAAIESEDIGDRYGARARLTGSATLAYEELQSVTLGAEIAAAVALVAVAIILMVGLRSGKLVLAALATLIVGLLLTAAMATATVGELNLISVAFAVLYIGLGIDYAIHFCLRVSEAQGDRPFDQALLQAGTGVGRSLALCALTTATGLYAFMPTSYRGIAELGWISGTGMFISLFVTLTLLPALLMMLNPSGRRDPVAERANGWLNRCMEIPQRYPRLICGAALLLGLLSLALLPFVRFDPNTLNLQADHLESVQAYRDLLADGSTSPMSGLVMVRDPGQVARLSGRLESLELVEEVRSVQDFIPADQSAKLAIIDELGLLLGGTLASSGNDPLTPEERRRALDALLAWLDRHPPAADEPALARLHEELRAFSGMLRTHPQRADRMLARLEQHLLQNLPGRLQALSAALNAEPVTYETLPESLRRHWVSPNGWYRLEVMPRENLDNETEMRRFVDAVRAVTPNLIGPPVIQLEAGDSVVAAFVEAFLLALGVISLLLILLLRSVLDTLLALLPILLAALLTAAGTVLLDVPFNFANIIALPLLLGIGIDNSIHILHRHHARTDRNQPILRSSATRAILVSALTTICSIGNLAFSSHRGTASMGLLLTIGISMTLVCALILLPALLNWRRSRNSH